jgi:hypothetical protein
MSLAFSSLARPNGFVTARFKRSRGFLKTFNKRQPLKNRYTPTKVCHVDVTSKDIYKSEYKHPL